MVVVRRYHWMVGRVDRMSRSDINVLSRSRARRDGECDSPRRSRISWMNQTDVGSRNVVVPWTVDNAVRA